MNKHEYRERMRKIKWMAKHKKEKFGKKEMLVAQEMTLAMMPQEKKQENWKSAYNEPISITRILGGMIDGNKSPGTK